MMAFCMAIYSTSGTICVEIRTILSLGELRKQVPETHALPRIQTAGRLVQNQDFRLVQQRLGNPHPSFIPPDSLLIFLFPHLI